MEAKRGKVDPGKRRCDRCEQRCGPVRECCFTFRESYAHWKAIWEDRNGKRLTRRRKQRLQECEEEQVDLKALSGVAFWMDLCDGCGEQCSPPWNAGFPMDFYETVLANPQGWCCSRNLVPEKTLEGPSGLAPLPSVRTPVLAGRG